MSPDLKRLRIERYHALFRAAAGDHPLALGDAEGAPLWSSEGCARTGIGPLLQGLSVETREQASAGCGAHSLAGGTLAFVPIRDSGDPVAWLATWIPDTGDAEAVLETATRLLVEIARCAEDDLLQEREVEGLADELVERSEELHVIYDFDRNLRSSDVIGIGLARVLAEFADSIGADVAALIRTEDQEPICTVNPGYSINNMDLVMVQLQSNLARFMGVRRRPLVLNDMDDPRHGYLFCHLPFKVLAHPIADEENNHGVLVLLRDPERRDFSSGDQSLTGVVAHQSAALLRNHAMLQKLRRFGEQMASALIEAVEAKDPYTRGHSERVQGIAVHLGGTLELSEHDLEDIYWGALLHDIGKIGVPDAILSKPGRLTEDEFHFIQGHPERSYEIIRHIEYLRPGAIEGARYHQERFDGKGYPTGLAGVRIPYPARVIAVADTYDAITSSRAYRPGADHETALAIVVEAAGTQLDPDVVAAFDDLCREDPRWLNRIRTKDTF